MTRRDLAKLMQEADQDEAEAVAWWNDASNFDKLQLWNAIQRDYAAHPILDWMARMAQQTPPPRRAVSALQTALLMPAFRRTSRSRPLIGQP